jgi:ABC-type uncharacterized transport system permease subunit
MPVGVREVESLLGFAMAGLFLLVWWLYDAISLGIFILPITFFTVLVPSLGPERYTFPSEGVRLSWLVAHIAALLAAYVALGFSLLASVLYLVQERRLKSKHKPGEDSWWLPLDWLPPLDTLERIAHATLEFGFPCITVGSGHRLGAGAGDAPGRGLFPRPKGYRLLRDVGSFTSPCSSFAAAPACADAGPFISPAWSSW